MRLRKRPYRAWYVIGNNGGEVALARQFAGLHLVGLQDKTVLELGSAEGLVSLEMVKHGAKLVHGLELRDRAVEVARSIAHVTGNDERMRFWRGSFSDAPDTLSQPEMLSQYDVVTAMAVLHKIPDQPRVLNCMLEKCKHTFVIRLPVRKVFQYRFRKTAWSFQGQDILPLIEKQGFKMRWESVGYPTGDDPSKCMTDSWLGVFDRK
jgi:2-polyprenyl-3-methyl-5-hydroxy-6-metoxy-1,4-benzoquinol methylase